MVNWDFLFISDLWAPQGLHEGRELEICFGQSSIVSEEKEKTLSLLLLTLSVAQAALTHLYTPQLLQPQLLMYLQFWSCNSHSALQKMTFKNNEQCFKSIAEHNIKTHLRLRIIYVHRAGVIGWKQSKKKKWVSLRHDAPGRNGHHSGWTFKQMNQGI